MGAVLDQLKALREEVKGVGDGLHEVQMTLARREADATEVERLRSKVDSLTTDMAAMKVRSGVWGLLGGLLPALGVALFAVLS